MTKGLHKNSLRKGEPNKWIVEDIIEKLKAEVERLWNEHPTEDGWDRGYNYACEEIMSVLSDLEKSNSKDFPTTDEEMKQFLATHPKVELHEKYKTPDWMFEKSEKPSNPVCEGLKEEIEYYLDHAELKAKCNGISVAQDYFDDLTNAARHFAKWQKEHDAELIEIAYNDGITIGMTKQKEQMMKEAVEGRVVDAGIFATYNTPVEYTHSGDKVKIIIVKED